jgi:hypothetical protein
MEGKGRGADRGAETAEPDDKDDEEEEGVVVTADGVVVVTAESLPGAFLSGVACVLRLATTGVGVRLRLSS